jgi:hypothetical protein
MKNWQKATVLMVAIPAFIGSLLIMFNQGAEFYHNIGMGQSQDNIVHVDLSGNIISNTTHFVDDEALNGTGTNFKLAHAPNPPNSLQLYYNGILYPEGNDGGYVLSGNSITTAFDKEPWDQLHASYRY